MLKEVAATVPPSGPQPWYLRTPRNWTENERGTGGGERQTPHLQRLVALPSPAQPPLGQAAVRRRAEHAYWGMSVDAVPTSLSPSANSGTDTTKVSHMTSESSR